MNDILTGRKVRRPRTPWFVYAIAAVLVGGLSAWFGFSAWRSSEAEVALASRLPLETSICEQLLTQASLASPDRFFICASRPKTIYKLADGERRPMPLMANAVYDLDVDGETSIENLQSPDMRYGWGGRYCVSLQLAYRHGLVRLTRVPVDEDSC